MEENGVSYDYNKRHGGAAGLTPSDFGAATWSDHAHIEAWQRAHGLRDDGAVGPATVAVALAERKRTQGAATAPSVPVVPAYTTGLDFSGWNGDIVDPGDDDEDMRKVAAAGHRFVVLKASEGETYRLKSMSRLRQAARAAGLGVGLYHYATPSASADDPELEAKNFHAAAVTATARSFVDGHARADSLWLDIEDPKTALVGPSLVVWCQRFLLRADDLFGCRVGVYSGKWYWDGWIVGRKAPANVRRAALAAFEGRALWLAAYPKKVPAPDAVWPTLDGWKPAMWQYSATATVPGLKGKFDVNRRYVS